MSHTTQTHPPARTARPARGGGTTRPLPLLVKVLGLGIVAALAVLVTPPLIAQQRWGFLGVFWGVVALLAAVYATKRAVPAKYLVPGVLFLSLLVVYPILMTFQLSTTNYGDGTRTPKEVTISRIIASAAFQGDNARRFTLEVGTTGSVDTGPYTFFLVDQASGDAYAGTEDGLEPLPTDATVTDGRVTAVPGYTMLTKQQINHLSQSGGPLAGFTVPTGESSVITAQGFQAVELTSPLVYDQATDSFTDTRTGDVYTPQRVGDRSYFTDANGARLSSQSWGESIGLDNYKRIFTDATISKNFLGIFAWTVLFAVASVGLSFLLGLVLAVTLNDARMRGQKLYRSILLLPYAIPGFISLMVWSSFYNTDFGLFNELLGTHVNWLGSTALARIAVILTNLWMGFPYMFLVCTGALQAVPSELKEAASIDGASGFTQFRKVTFPLVLVAVAPLLVASFAFNFNNFNAIQLLTEGGPFSASDPTAGGTDILISFTYRLAFGTSAQQIGFASAISVILFILTGVLAAIQFRGTRVLEDVN
ncbi:ABC transporter permease subunit [Isoptericola sp. b490]|uniref:ABC transporter permease subunit n=1 Tax=Actinotalea lenta TaxID=3064654 RepID=UPI002713A348|nr:ABC transporter permease subunit [Isoptericola sp. b490]MDO8122141.1 ABC transporter permease subunit [Isoptericola sp. b490]